MEYREATLEDAVQLSKLFHAYRQLSVSLDNPANEDESSKWISSRILDGNGIFLIALSDKKLLGFATLYQGFSSISLNHYWILNDLFVTNEARGSGLGRGLMEFAERYAKKTNAKGIELETAVDNKVAQSLYEDLGYIENTRYKTYFKKMV